MKTIAVIPARGGSKRIPRKNIRPFLGRPIIAYSIELALNSGLFNVVMVSTDDPEIAAVAKQHGASVPFMRSAKNADDHATTMEVLEEVLHKYEKEGACFDLVCCLYPTAPLCSIERVQAGCDKLANEEFEVVFPVTAFSYPIWRGLEINADGSTHMLWPENQNKRSQDLPSVYHDAGQWYWFKRSAIGHPIFGNNTGAIILPEEEVQDIDTPSDWRLAELKYELLQSFK